LSDLRSVMNAWFTEPFMRGIVKPPDYRVHRGNHGDLSVISVPCPLCEPFAFIPDISIRLLASGI
jgi:hypothetical protein